MTRSLSDSARPARPCWVNERGITAAIHIRRGDKVYDLGYVVPPLHYFQLAISRLHSLFPEQGQCFVMSSDDSGWVRASPLFAGMEVLSSEDPSFDMAVISECQHKILSIGTFGWWGAFLNNRGDNQTSAVIYPLPQMEFTTAYEGVGIQQLQLLPAALDQH